jgi:crotonobetainyl-CoA:carnitine CoA-transferase CaiB-like acyl-CoA transferase
MRKALEGIKVLDFTKVYSGPYCTMLMADMGAELIKVETIGKGDETRAFAPIKDGVSAYYNYLNRNKKSITLDLKSEEGRKVALDLAKWADIIVENFAAGTIGKLRLGYEDIVKVNPEIIYASISGFGQYGPYKDKLAYDAIAQAMGGLTSLSGLPGRMPTKVTPALSDAITGVHMAYAIMVALFHKEKTGEGQYIDVAMTDVVFSVLEAYVTMETLLGANPQRIGNASMSAVPYDIYTAKDNYIVIGAPNDSLFVKLAKAMKREDLLEDPRFNTNMVRIKNRDAIDAIISEWAAQFTVAEIEAMLNEARIPVAPIKSIAELVKDPGIAAREMLIEHDNPVHGKVKYPGNPLKLQKTPPDTSKRAPLLGEHTEEILKSILGYSQENIEKLKKNRTV